VSELSTGRVDETITAVEGDWRFNSEVAQSFDSHVRKSIPFYEEIQNMTVDMSTWFVCDGGLVYDLGCSTGETILRLVDRYPEDRRTRYVGIDNSLQMIETARSKVGAGKVRFLCQDVLETRFEPTDLVISLFTLQFLAESERLRLVQRIYESLRVGGAFVMAEKVLGETARFDGLWVELYWEFKRRQGLTDAQILQKARSLRGVLRPLSLQANLRLLETAGFESTDVFFKWYNFAGLLAIKSGTSADGKTHCTPLPGPVGQSSTKHRQRKGNRSRPTTTE
jgi:tRNA (cmo5U34)-methyltransferase